MDRQRTSPKNEEPEDFNSFMRRYLVSPSSYIEETREVKPKKPLDLYLPQWEHVKRMATISGHSASIRDTSETGLGKSITAFRLSQILGVRLFIVCPIVVIEPWKDKFNQYSDLPPYYDITNYEQLKAKASKYLTKYEVASRGKKKEFVFRVTPYFKEMVKAGMLFVVDESHRAKNQSQNTQAVSELTNFIKEAAEDIDHPYHNGRSRILLMSATAVDKKKQIPILLDVLGIASSDILKIVSDIGREVHDEELRAFIKKAHDINPQMTESILMSKKYYMERDRYGHIDFDLVPQFNYVGNTGVLEDMIFQLAEKVVLRNITSEMTPFVPREAFRGYFDLDPYDMINNPTWSSTDRWEHGFVNTKRYVNAIEAMATANSSDYRGPRGSKIPEKDVPLARITKAMGEIDEASLEGATYFLMRELRRNPDSKVILAVSRIRTLELAVREFEKLNKDNAQNGIATFGVKELRGETKNKDEVIKEFNADNGYIRALVMMTSLGSGIDLHDTSRFGRERTILVLPDWNLINVHQTTGRIFRATMTTIGRAFVFYSNVAGALFQAVSHALREKSDVTKLTIYRDSTSKRKFPGNYPRFVDNNDGGFYIDEERLGQIPEVSEYTDDYKFVNAINLGVPLPLNDPPPSRPTDIPPVDPDDEEFAARGEKYNSPHTSWFTNSDGDREYINFDYTVTPSTHQIEFNNGGPIPVIIPYPASWLVLEFERMFRSKVDKVKNGRGIATAKELEEDLKRYDTE